MFQSGDQARHIHWRSTARRGQIMMKEFDGAPQSEVLLTFNPSVDIGHGRESTLEYSVKITASVAHWCFQQGRPFLMWPSPGEGTPPTLSSVLEFLASLEKWPEETSIEPFLSRRGPMSNLIVVVSDSDQETLRSLGHQRSSLGHTVTILLEGFSEDDDLVANRPLLPEDMATVPCRKGEIASVLASLSGTLHPKAPVAR